MSKFKTDYRAVPVTNDISSNDYWSPQDWISHHKALKKAYGRDHANYLIQAKWKGYQYGINQLLTDFTSFNKYMAANGVDISAGSPMTAFSQLWAAGKKVLIIGGVAVGGYAGYQIYRGRQFNRAIRNAATAPRFKPSPKLNGINAANIAIGVGVTAALGVGAYFVLRKDLGQIRTTPNGIKLYETKDFYIKCLGIYKTNGPTITTIQKVKALFKATYPKQYEQWDKKNKTNWIKGLWLEMKPIIEYWDTTTMKATQYALDQLPRSLVRDLDNAFSLF
jgi:hypothetical protein